MGLSSRRVVRITWALVAALAVAAAVDGVGVPFPEEDVRPLIHRVEVVVGARIEREFVEMIRCEARLVEQDRIG